MARRIPHPGHLQPPLRNVEFLFQSNSPVQAQQRRLRYGVLRRQAAFVKDRARNIAIELGGLAQGNLQAAIFLRGVNPVVQTVAGGGGYRANGKAAACAPF